PPGHAARRPLELVAVCLGTAAQATIPVLDASPAPASAGLQCGTPSPTGQPCHGPLPWATNAPLSTTTSGTLAATRAMRMARQIRCLRVRGGGCKYGAPRYAGGRLDVESRLLSGSTDSLL